MASQSDGRHSSRGRVTPWNGPRTVLIPRTDRGFGFTLRHFIVYPPEPKDFLKEREYASDDDDGEDLYYQRIQPGNLEPLDTIFVKNVKDGGPAHKAGLNPGDRIISVNGEPVTGKSYGQVINLIQQSNADLNLLVVPKEEDILQLAYQNSTQTYDTDYGIVNTGGSGGIVHPGPGHSSVKVSQYPQPSMDRTPYKPPTSRDRKVLSTSSLLDGPDQLGRLDRDPPRRSLTTSTSYTSGLSVYREPPQEENMNKNVFLDRKREFETRAAQENVNPNSSKTYSFGLYFPKKDSRVNNSAENLSRSVVVRRSRESVLQPTDSQENISKLHSSTSRTRNVPIEYRHSGTPDQKTADRFRSAESLGQGHDPETGSARPQTRYSQGGSIRHSFPDPGVQVWSSPNRRISESDSPYGFDQGTPTPDSSGSKRDSYSSSRQYVPVINESATARNQKMSGSVDSIDPRSNVFHTEHHLRTAFNNSNVQSPEQQNQNQSSPSRTFIVKIGDNKERSNTPNVTLHDSGHAGNHSNYGAAFALTRSPASGQEKEIRIKSEPQILVSHRKQQFEKRTDITPPSNANTNQNRYKTEIEKNMTFRKFEGVQSRMASFEKNGGNSAEPLRSRSQTPVSAQPISKVRRMSQERVKSPETTQNLNTQGNSQSNYADSAPIRIYVSQGSSNTSGSPIVEIVPMQTSPYDLSDVRGQEQYVAHDNQPVSPRDMTDGESHNKPTRKASFLSAVNAPYSRYLPQTGYENEIPVPDATPKSSRVTYSTNQSRRETNATPTNYQWAGRTTSPARALSPTNLGTSSNSITISTSSLATSPQHDGTTTVRLRNKPEISAEDFETKLHRRTSYLMATAKDRSAVSLTMSPNSNSSVPMDPNSTPATFSKHKSMRKLKDFFGEKTPKIVEAQEKKQDPASPIQQVIREGSLGVKVDMIDGKRASDRSWRPVWAVLRGHALYLCKEKRDPASNANLFSYDEQPISIKSCMVDIAHGYTKKKNVFRMKMYNGSEYLFQAEDQDDMLGWIRDIKTNNNPDADSHGITSAELIIRKSQEGVDTAPVSQTTIKVSPPPQQKIGKKPFMSIKQKIPHSPNLSRRKTSGGKDDTGKPKTRLGKIGKSFKKQFGSSPTTNITRIQEGGSMFGLPLEECTASPNNEFVPLIVDLCTQIVEAKGLEMTGVYRIPGNKAAVTLLQEEFNKGLESMNLEHEKWSDVNVISSLLKSFFRQLPEPLIPDELYQPFIDASRIEDPERRMLKLKRLIHELPEHHFETFKHLAKHLNKVALYGDVNRMEGKNLAIVFGPTLIRTADEDMVAMFTDMSDHCKIIESIVLHCDWFFGSWENDNYVPTDDDATECTSIISAMTSSTRDDLDNISINPREIVCSIVEAANRKLRGEQENSTVTTENKRSVSISEPPTAKFNERNIDQEIVLRTRKIDTTSKSSPNLSAMQRTSDIIKPLPQELNTDRRMAKSQEICDRDFPDFDFIDSEKEYSSAYLTPTTRYFSDESLLDRNDELEMSHGTQNGNYRLSREMLDSLRRIEMEARALREREERRQRDLEKRKLEKQRIEQDILQTQQELELEEGHSVEDLLNAQKGGSGSEYQTSYKRKVDTGGSYRSAGSGDRSGTGKYSPGGKYFVVKGNASQDRMSRPPRQTSVESLVKQSKRTSSLENMSDANQHSRGHGRPQARVRGRKGDNDRSKRDSSEIKRFSSGLSRSNSIRRGSLDSLIDLIEKRDNRMSWASTDSDDGLDLLTALTSTFDQKLQNLSSPKSSVTNTNTSVPLPPRRVPYNASNSSLNKTNTSVTSPMSVESNTHNAQHCLPPQVPLSMVHRQTSATDAPAKQYRDPSLHRTPPKPDTKIGLATRFERTTTHNPMYEVRTDSNNLNALNRFNTSNSNTGVNVNSEMTYLVDSPPAVGNRSAERTNTSDSRVSSVMVVISSPSVMSADSRQSGGYSASHYVSKPVMSSCTANQPKWETTCAQSPTATEYRPISKSEKTEVNVKLSQVFDKNKNFDNQSGTVKSRSASPPASSRSKRIEKRSRRRHTVGGTNDGEHMKAITEASKKDEGRPTAWEQLRPAVRDSSNNGPNSSLLSWLRNERIRGSSPDLSSHRGDTKNAKRN